MNDSIEKEKEEETCGPVNKNKGEKMSNIQKAMIKFIVKERLPISKLESVHLSNLINGMCESVICLIPFLKFVIRNR